MSIYCIISMNKIIWEYQQTNSFTWQKRLYQKTYIHSLIKIGYLFINLFLRMKLQRLCMSRRTWTEGTIYTPYYSLAQYGIEISNSTLFIKDTIQHRIHDILQGKTYVWMCVHIPFLTTNRSAAQPCAYYHRSVVHPHPVSGHWPGFWS